MIKGYMKMQLRTSQVPVEIKEFHDSLNSSKPILSVEDALKIIQRHERGRQGEQTVLIFSFS